MYLIRVIVGVCAVIISVKIGVDKSSKYKNEYYFWLSLIAFCDSYILEISYKKTEINNFLKYKSSSLDFDNFLNFFIKENKLLYPNYINFEEQNLINNVFNAIGKTNSQTQIELFNGYKENFSKILDEKHKTYQKFYSVSLKLSFICGLVLFIMVI